jgi:hypothetical protein
MLAKSSLPFDSEKHIFELKWLSESIGKRSRENTISCLYRNRNAHNLKDCIEIYILDDIFCYAEFPRKSELANT